MNLKVKVRQFNLYLFALALLSLMALLVLGRFNPPQIQAPPRLGQSDPAAPAAFDAERAADISAQRWQAMADFYEAQGMLTRDPLTDEAAGVAAVAVPIDGGFASYTDRYWAMADAYAARRAEAEEAADISAQRWLAMARFYEAHGMLTRDPLSSETADSAAAVPTDDGFASYTDRYWAMAEAHAAVLTAAGGFAFYTERYWQMASDD